jgi:ribosomal-protein-alanine N-acetyltransferase
VVTVGEVCETPVLHGRRVTLRPIEPEDFEAWRALRRRNRERLTIWEPRRTPGQPDPAEDRQAFSSRCGARRRERQLSTGWGFGMFLGGSLMGEMNLSNLVRGAFHSAHVGYWIDKQQAGCGYTPEALVVLARFAFEQLDLHRLQVAIVPRNAASRRVVDKVGLRCEGLAERYLEINGVWEDHLRYAITAEEWGVRSVELKRDWLD